VTVRRILQTGWRALPILVVAGLAGQSLGCSSGNASADGSSLSAGDGQFVDCSKETRATPYAPGTVVASTDGKLKVTLVDNRPGPADANNPPGNWVKGSNTWDLSVSDGAGQPLDGLDIQAVPRMPDHMHGTSITPITNDEGQGQYQISPLYLYMGGYWQITLNIRSPVDSGTSFGLAGDSVVFSVCIPD
jgi:hypothetical protein